MRIHFVQRPQQFVPLLVWVTGYRGFSQASSFHVPFDFGGTRFVVLVTYFSLIYRSYDDADRHLAQRESWP